MAFKTAETLIVSRTFTKTQIRQNLVICGETASYNHTVSTCTTTPVFHNATDCTHHCYH